MAPGPHREFFQVLTDAINDLVANGFDSMDRVNYWASQLEAAARRASADPARLEQQLSDALHAIYRRQVELGGVLKTHPGVGRFVLERVRPALRAELDRRILASANLIKLNREATIEKTLQRFKGWSTSLPPRPTPKSTDKPEVKQNIAKALSQFKFEERRVLVDQGHKLSAAISHTVAAGGGAIACVWHSHWRQAGYNYREEHKERDGVIYLLRSSWAADKGYVKPGEGGYYDDITAVAEEPFCRCNAQWLYHLRELPPEMITKKGQEAMEAARRAVMAA
jgi:hypothetical protein